MPYTMKVEGAEELSAMLNKMGEQAQSVASKGLYKGAGIMADEIHSQAAGISTEPFHYAVFITREVSPEEKEIIQGKAGIAKFDKNGSEVNTAVGFSNSGYAILAGRRKPIPLIANSINSGTSFLRKQPFFRQAVTNGGPRASSAIIESIEDAFDEMTK